jgi:hypothetical protein
MPEGRILNKRLPTEDRQYTMHTAAQVQPHGLNGAPIAVAGACEQLQHWGDRRAALIVPAEQL